MTYSLSDFGSYTVAGRVHEVTVGEPRNIRFTRSASYTYDPKGHFAIEHAYVQYFVPANRNSSPPVVLVHGGGMHGSTWETTPDGRPGWVNHLVGLGYETHVVDNVERGRSGFATGIWEGDPICRSQQEAWTLFRIGPSGGFSTRTPFENGQFPVKSFDAFSRMLVPRWLTTTPLHVAALVAVLKRLGPAIIICHSQGGEIALDAMAEVPDLFAGFIGIEPSTRLSDPELVAPVPTVLFAGDFLDIDHRWRERQQHWSDWVVTNRKHGGRATLIRSGHDLRSGHTHMPMLDHGSEDCLSACLQALT
ncbi:pimeloyl-ACP methyl ester carboxylesterase [Labrenzia sp. EL_13]|nr:pimeloyl-ACP methyl ester carboxylesterase [Labrenzia sp. EL_13]